MKSLKNPSENNTTIKSEKIIQNSSMANNKTEKITDEPIIVSKIPSKTLIEGKTFEKVDYVQAPIYQKSNIQQVETIQRPISQMIGNNNQVIFFFLINFLLLYFTLKKN